MSDRKPADDLKDGLGLLFRAARGFAREVAKDDITEKAEKTIQDGMTEVVRAINSVGKTIGSELEKNFGGGSSKDPPSRGADGPPAEPPVKAESAEKPKSGPDSPS